MIYFSSDHHFDHANIIKYCERPFSNVGEMNERMVSDWNDVVAAGDVVYYLGDFSLSLNAVEKFLPRLNGEKRLVMGNHDKCHPTNKKKARAALLAYEDLGFKVVGTESKILIGEVSVRLHHMPYLAGENEPGAPPPRFVNYRPQDDGKWLLHGHVHQRWKVKEKMINVGVDVWEFKPVSIDQIEKIIEQKSQ